MKKISLIIVFVGLLLTISAQAQEATEEPQPCPNRQVFDEERNACIENGTIELSIATPQWINEYPIASDIVSAYVMQQRITFLTSVFELPQDRALYFNLGYEEGRYADVLASVLFRVDYDLGGISPLSEIRSFTFNLELGIPVELSELMLPNANPVSTFGPLVPPEAVEEGFASLISGGLDDPALFETWVLSDEGITFYYPPFRQGPTNAGIYSVFLPMDVVGSVLILPEASGVEGE